MTDARERRRKHAGKSTLPPQDPSLSELAEVLVRFEHDYRPTRYIVLRSQVEVFVEATVRLHHSPGVNPHNGKPTSRISMIEVAEIVPTGPFWWSTPDLQDNGDPNGATIYQDLQLRRVWASPSQLEADRIAEEEED